MQQAHNNREHEQQPTSVTPEDGSTADPSPAAARGGTPAGAPQQYAQASALVDADIGSPAARRMGVVLTTWRHALGWTQDDLASRAGISRGHLSRLERGSTERPGMDVLTRVCGATGHTWPELYARAGVSLPGDVTFDDMHAGLNDPELVLYLRRLPELDARDRSMLRTILRALFEREEVVPTIDAPDARQLAFPMGSAPVVAAGITDADDDSDEADHIDDVDDVDDASGYTTNTNA